MTTESLFTDVGLVLKIDRSRSNTENFFLQLFGRWPKTKGKLPKDRSETLCNFIRQCIPDDWHTLTRFFGLEDTFLPESAYADLIILKRIDYYLTEIRHKYKIEILCIYGEDLEISKYDITRRNIEILHRNNELERELNRCYLTHDCCNPKEASKLLESNVTSFFDNPIGEILEDAGVKTVDHLVSCTPKQISKLPGVTYDMFIEIVSILSTKQLLFYSPIGRRIKCEADY